MNLSDHICCCICSSTDMHVRMCVTRIYASLYPDFSESGCGTPRCGMRITPGVRKRWARFQNFQRKGILSVQSLAFLCILCLMDDVRCTGRQMRREE